MKANEFPTPRRILLQKVVVYPRLGPESDLVPLGLVWVGPGPTGPILWTPLEKHPSKATITEEVSVYISTGYRTNYSFGSHGFSGSVTDLTYRPLFIL